MTRKANGNCRAEKTVTMRREKDELEKVMDPRYVKAVELEASGLKKNEVAKRLGIHRSTLSLWEKDPNFGALLNRYRRHAWDVAIARLFRILPKAPLPIESAIEKGDTKEAHWYLEFMAKHLMSYKAIDCEDPVYLAELERTKDRVKEEQRLDMAVDNIKWSFRRRGKRIGLDSEGKIVIDDIIQKGDPKENTQIAEGNPNGNGSTSKNVEKCRTDSKTSPEAFIKGIFEEALKDPEIDP